ncbi:MAG TPA: C40 family peptidase [Longimicrobiales bacterium]|nr:C40 family peptidase [Longimicrobiales bacterium]
MQRPTTPAACLLTAGLLASPLAGQGITLSAFTAVDQGLEPAPRTIGLAATGWAGAAGLRVSGAMDIQSSPVAPLLGYPPADGTRAWAADADLVLSGGRAGLSLLAIDPALFVGFGVHGRRRSDGSSATIPAWSYGAGISVPLASRVSLDAEGRYRMPHQSDDRLLPADVRGGWEMRAGLALHLGALRAAPPPTRTRGMPTIRMGRAGGTPAPAPTSGTRSASADAVARNVLDTADDYVGVPYRWGGESPREGFDCSGYVQYVFARNGVRVPRVSRDQARAGRPVSPVVSALLPGDLMFYAGSDGVVNHVAIYAGGDRIIHSSSTGRGVRYDDLSSRRGRYYATRMVAARRVIPDGGLFFLP